MVPPGARLAVGSQDTAITCSFEEGGGNSPLLQMAMQVGRPGGRGRACLPACLPLPASLPLPARRGSAATAVHGPHRTLRHPRCALCCAVQGLMAGASKEVKEQLDL